MEIWEIGTKKLAGRRGLIAGPEESEAGRKALLTDPGSRLFHTPMPAADEKF